MSLIDRLGGLAGIGAAIYLFFLPGCICDLWIQKTGPDVEPGDPSAVIAETLAANRDSGRLGAYFGLITVFLLVVFFSRLYGALRKVSCPSSWLPIAALAGGILMAGIVLFESGLSFAASELTSYGGETEIVKFFALWGWNSASLMAPPFALALAGTTPVAFSTEAFPKWYQRASITLLVLLLLISGVMRAPGLALAPGVLWMFLTSFVLATRVSTSPGAGLEEAK